MNGQQNQDITSHNEQAFKVLVRAITLSEGTFSLILVRCNYAELGQQVYQQLNTTCSNTVEQITLPSSAKTLYTVIKQELNDRAPAALMILGLDSVTAIDDLLAATNQVRDSFRKHFAFPLVLWCNDDILRRFRKLAPDFYSWTSVPIQFGLDTETLVQRIHTLTDAVFVRAMEIGAGRFPHSSAVYLSPSFCPRQELQAALADLKTQGQDLTDPILTASLQFIWGLDAHANNQMNQAKAQYTKSLQLLAKQKLPNSDPSYQLRIERLSCVLFYSGVWWRRYAVLHRAEYIQACSQARECYRRCIELLQKQHRPDLAAKFIVALGEVLCRLKQWRELSIVAETAVKLQKTYFDPIRLAYSYGFLAEVALIDQDWNLAKQYAETALDVNHQKPLETAQAQHQHQELSWAQNHYQSLYLLLLAEAQWNLDLFQAAIENLEQAKDYCKPGYDPLLYVRILETLRQYYFQQGEYLKAFRTKQQQRSIGQQYRLQAFVGAGRLRPERQIVTPALTSNQTPEPLGDNDFSSVSVAQEISASGREEDLINLMTRIRGKQYKLTILHGQSGVGKSSMVNAGLVPALLQSPIEARNVIPIVLRNYSDWRQEFKNCLSSSLKTQNIQVASPKSQRAFEPQNLIKQLEYNEHNRLQTVIIFDQFEEFFFNCSKPEERQEFFKFLKQCLDLAYVKVILALREDYLHYLLACDDFEIDAINNDILGRQNRYSLGNLSVTNTKLLIQRLTRRSQFNMENELIERLTEDLAQEFGEVRPIELQVVGMQLQEEDITTLTKYEALGENPKETLIGRFLEQVIRDCGPENEKIANLVLFLLTDEKGTRPMKTMDELRSNISKLMPDSNEPFQNLELILEILVESGLVLVLLFRETPVLQEVPPPRYQLVHDYLVELIRQKQEPALIEQLSQNQAELERLRKEKELIEKEQELKKLTEEKQRIEAQVREEKLKAELALQQEQQKSTSRELKQEKKQRKKINKFIFALCCLVLTTGSSAVIAWNIAQKAKITHLKSKISEASVRSSSGEGLDGLILSIEAGEEITRRSLFNVARKSLFNEKERFWLMGQLSKVLQHQVKEFNRLERGHSDWITDIDFGSNDDLIASASADGTVRLWKSTGDFLPFKLEHDFRVNRVRFSPNGQILATASGDKTVKLWDLAGIQKGTLGQHNYPVTSISFSPDQKTLATSSGTQVILWDLTNYQRKVEISATQGEYQRVTSVMFSPDGKNIATASSDKTVKLWDHDGRFIKTLKERAEDQTTHSEEIIEVSFSPDRKYIASGDVDGKIKIWTRDGEYMETLHTHTDRITGLNFHPHQTILVSASEDKTVRLWKLDTNQNSFILKNTIENTGATSVRFNSDGGILAFTRNDNIVRLFRLEGMSEDTFSKHTGSVNSVDFSPDGQIIVSGEDSNYGQKGSNAISPGNIILWNSDKAIHHEIVSLGRVLNTIFSPNGKIIASLEELISLEEPISNDFQDQGFKGKEQTLLSRPNTSEKSEPTTKIVLRGLDGQQLETLRTLPLTGKNAKISFSSDGRFIAVSEELDEASTSSQVTIWDILSKQKPTTFQTLNDPISDISFNPKKTTLATANTNGVINFWNLEGSKINELKTNVSDIKSMRFSSDGRFVAFGDEENKIQVWDVHQEKKIYASKGHIGNITSVDFYTRNSKILAAASDDGAIKIWDVEDGVLLANFEEEGNAVNSIKFSPDGRTIAAATSNKKVVLWNLDPKRYVDISCDWIKDYLENGFNVSKDSKKLCR